MAQSYIPASPAFPSYVQGSVAYSKALLMQNIRQANFRRKLTEPLNRPLEAILGTEPATSTSFTYPFVQLTDLTQSKSGDRVAVDLMNRIQTPPIMGDVQLKPFAVPMTYDRDQVVIDLYNLPINAGGMLTQQRNPHDMRMNGIQQAAMWMSDIEDNLCTVEICGARGYDAGSGWQLPIQTNVNLTSYFGGNPINPPTLNRYFVPGVPGATGPDQVTTSSVLSLEFFDNLRTQLMNADVPLQGVRMAGGSKESGTDYDVGNSNTPLFICGLTMEQYNTLRTATPPGDWNTAVTNANTRLDFRRHPLFADGECLLWRNIFFFVYGRPVTIPAGSYVPKWTSAAATATSNSTATVRVQRGFVLGSQAMGIAFGDCSPRMSGKIASKGTETTMQNGPYSWIEEIEEGNVRYFFARVLMGLKKLTYNFTNQGTTVPWDNGVAIFDSYQASLTG